MGLPPNYYDFMCKYRRNMVALAEQDASELLRGSNPPVSIRTVHDYGSRRFYQLIERLNADLLGYGDEHPGVSEADMLLVIDRSGKPEEKAYVEKFWKALANEYHAVVNFALAGKKTFHFSDNLTDHLANTEINLKASLIQLPFPTCLFTFTARTVVNAMYNLRGDAERETMNVSGLDYDVPVSVFLTMDVARGGLPGRELVIRTWHGGLSNKSHAHANFMLHLEDNMMLEEVLRTGWETLRPGSSIAVPNFYRVVLNAVLYLLSDEAELAAKENPRREIESRAKSIASLSKRRKLLQTTNRYTALDYQEVGASVGPIVIQKGATEGNGSSAGGGKPLVRFMVRGHWRRQSHGAENKERKLVWIRPYYKGDDLASVINKPYLVK